MTGEAKYIINARLYQDLIKSLGEYRLTGLYAPDSWLKPDRVNIKLLEQRLNAPFETWRKRHD